MSHILIERSSPIQPICYKNVRKEKDTEANVLPHRCDPRIQLLLIKFKCGKKLTAEEMCYIRKHAPELGKLIGRITCERERLEQALKVAPLLKEIDLTIEEPDQNEVEEKHNNGSSYYMEIAIRAYEQTKKYCN